MFFRKRRTKLRKRRFAPLILLALTVASLFMTSSCSSQTGSIEIVDGQNGVDFSAELSAWSSESTREIALGEGDELQIEFTCEDGKIGLVIESAGGSELYSGNNLPTMSFTVTAAESDLYTIKLTGNNASGKVTVKLVDTAEGESANMP